MRQLLQTKTETKTRFFLLLIS